MIELALHPHMGRVVHGYRRPSRGIGMSICLSVSYNSRRTDVSREQLAQHPPCKTCSHDSKFVEAYNDLVKAAA